MTTALAILPAPIEFAEGTIFSGAMRRLSTDRHRKFVIAMLESPTLNLGVCAARAGYQGDDNTLRGTGFRLAHDPRILEAIQEEAKNRMAGGAIFAVSRLLEIVSDPKASVTNQLRAIEMLLNRVGLHARTEVTQTINHNVTSDGDMIKRIDALSRQLGINPKTLLGTAGVIDAEFTDVSPASDLSDIL